MWKEMFLTRVPEYEEGAEENHANSLSKWFFPKCIIMLGPILLHYCIKQQTYSNKVCKESLHFFLSLYTH
jgi:hypothetical protein